MALLSERTSSGRGAFASASFKLPCEAFRRSWSRMALRRQTHTDTRILTDSQGRFSSHPASPRKAEEFSCLKRQLPSAAMFFTRSPRAIRASLKAADSSAPKSSLPEEESEADTGSSLRGEDSAALFPATLVLTEEFFSYALLSPPLFFRALLFSTLRLRRSLRWRRLFSAVFPFGSSIQTQRLQRGDRGALRCTLAGNSGGLGFPPLQTTEERKKGSVLTVALVGGRSRALQGGFVDGAV